MSGKTEAKFLIMGACFALAISVVSMPFLDIRTEDGSVYNPLDISLLKLLGYYLWLLVEIVKASWEVSKLVAARTVNTQPQAVLLKVSLKSPLAKSVYANSITLTPGTITIDVPDDDSFLVHALTDSAAEGLFTGEMERRIARLFGEDMKTGEEAAS